MSPRPTIFISAVSKELKSARQLVANTLTFLGYEPVWQDIFGTDQGDLRGMLRRQIDQCKGVVQLVGRCYGAEPPTIDEGFGRVSYTQYEALYAEQRRKKVWYLILQDDFPTDVQQSEPKELGELQVAYRQRLRRDSRLRYSLDTREALENSVLKLRNDLAQLRRGVKQWAVAVMGLLSLLVGAVIWLGIQQQEMAKKLQRGVTQYPDAEIKVRQSQQNQDPVVVQEITYDHLARQLNVDVKVLREKLPQFAQELRQSSHATLYERASAAFVTRDYTEAERLALAAADDARKTMPPNLTDAIKFLTLAGNSADARIDYAHALRHFREAENLTDRVRDPLEWADVQRNIAFVLDEQGQYSEAEKYCRAALEAYRRARGEEDKEVLALRNNLALLFDEMGNHAQATLELREVIKLSEKVVGLEQPNTLMARMNLASALRGEGKFAEAEVEYRDVIKRDEKTFGTEHSQTLAARNNLAITLLDQGGYAAAETELREVIMLEEAKLGPKHPQTLASRDTLAIALQAQGKLAEAEATSRSVIELRREVLGATHADTLNSHNNLALTLNEEGKFAEAEMESRNILKLDAQILGSDHPYRIESHHNLAVALCGQGKYAEAEIEFRRTIELRTKAFGLEHPDTLNSCYNFALCLKAENKMELGRQFADRAAQAAQTKLGAHHPNTIKYQKFAQEFKESD